SSADTLLYQQVPGHTFGVESDTLLRDDSGHSTSELLADNFSLAAPMSLPVCRVGWLGFYGSSLAQGAEPPPQNETMRIRLYDDAAGLPGTVLAETIVTNPFRQATGLVIPTGVGLPEFRYQADLAQCFVPQAGGNYWLEIAQLGDLDSRFRWENSNIPGGFAVQFPVDSPWRLTPPTRGQLTYELRTPEPCSGAMLLLGSALARGVLRNRP